MVTWEYDGSVLVLSLTSEGVRFLREQWSWLGELARWQLARCSDDPLAELTGLPIPTGPIDGRLAYVVDRWGGAGVPDPVRRVREAAVLHDLEVRVERALASLPRLGGSVRLPGRSAVGQWRWAVETLHVVLDVSGRINIVGSPDRNLPTPPSADETEVYRRSLRWLELVLDALTRAERAAHSRTGD